MGRLEWKKWAKGFFVFFFRGKNVCCTYIYIYGGGDITIYIYIYIKIHVCISVVILIHVYSIFIQILCVHIYFKSYTLAVSEANARIQVVEKMNGK